MVFKCGCPQIELDALLPKRRYAADDAASALHPPPLGLSLPQVCELITRKLALQEPDEVVRRAFRAFDGQAKGYVSLADLEAAVAAVAPHLPRHTVALAFNQLDADRDGRVAYGDFHAMMHARPAGHTPWPAS